MFRSDLVNKVINHHLFRRAMYQDQILTSSHRHNPYTTTRSQVLRHITEHPLAPRYQKANKRSVILLEPTTVQQYLGEIMCHRSCLDCGLSTNADQLGSHITPLISLAFIPGRGSRLLAGVCSYHVRFTHGASAGDLALQVSLR